MAAVRVCSTQAPCMSEPAGYSGWPRIGQDGAYGADFERLNFVFVLWYT